MAISFDTKGVRPGNLSIFLFSSWTVLYDNLSLSTTFRKASVKVIEKEKIVHTSGIKSRSDTTDDVGLHILAQRVISQSQWEEKGAQMDPPRTLVPVMSIGEPS
jgi:hypothetical protein